MNARATEESIDARIERVKFHRDGFAILAIKLRDSNGDTGVSPCSAKGSMLTPHEGADYVLRGHWEESKWGPTFCFATYELAQPADRDAMLRYVIATCAGSGLGEVRATAIVDAYGADTLRELKADPDKVAARCNVPADAARAASAMLLANERQEAIQLDLRELLAGTGIGPAGLRRILDTWGCDAPDAIRENPFCLVQIDGIGFPTADRVRAHLGIPDDAPSRLAAGAVHALREAARGDGHTALSLDLFLSRTWALLGSTVPHAAIEVAARDTEAIDIDETGPAGAAVALTKLRHAEREVADMLRALLEHPHGESPVPPRLERLAEDQVAVVKTACTSGVFVLTGAPGTGKTYAARAIADSFEDAGLRIALCAPTGKAAKRLSELTGRAASTIHRLLEPDWFGFARGVELPLEQDAILVDETSMVDVQLMAALARAMRPSMRLVLVGDIHQLPSVGPGAVLRDIIESGTIPFAELTEIKRQDPGDIILNCHRVKDGLAPRIANGESKDFFWIEHADANTIGTVIADLCRRRLPAKYGVNPVKDIQVLAPLREKTPTSCAALNEVLRRELNANRPVDGARFAVGDKVVQTANDYDAGIFNGDLGIVTDVRMRNGATAGYSVKFDAPERKVDLPARNDLELAYAMTVHKAQGSEWSIVVVPIHRCQGLILQRRWLYTAISRAKTVFVGIGQATELAKAAKRNDAARRSTALAEMIHAGENYQQNRCIELYCNQEIKRGEQSG